MVSNRNRRRVLFLSADLLASHPHCLPFLCRYPVSLPLLPSSLPCYHYLFIVICCRRSRLELGSVQLPSTTASASSVAAFVASTTVYPFRVCNVSNRNLAVVAVSNLKTQGDDTHIHTDNLCTSYLPTLKQT